MIGGGANAILILDELEPGLLEGILDVSDHQSRQRLLRIGFHYDPQMEQVSLIYVGVHSLKGRVKDWQRIANLCNGAICEQMDRNVGSHRHCRSNFVGLTPKAAKNSGRFLMT